MRLRRMAVVNQIDVVDLFKVRSKFRIPEQ